MSDPVVVDWRETLPAELKESPALKDFKDPAALAKSFVETKALVGNSIRRPGPDAGKEAWAEFRTKVLDGIPEAIVLPEDPEALKEVEAKVWGKMGRPDKPEGYTFDGVELAPGVKLNEDALRAGAAKMGLTKTQFKIAVAEAAAEAAARQAEVAKAQGALKTELGSAYGERLGHAASVAESLGFPKAAVEAIRAGNVSLEEGKAFLALAKKFTAEPNQVGGQGAGAGSGQETTTELLARRAEMMARPEYFDPRRGREVHAALVEKVRAINGELDRRRSG